ncbi:MAG: hypothetical protein SGI77_16460 [Pirellulaceae bacterium]|nr:hypothetical protein [Pirellulaceae bacterium]
MEWIATFLLIAIVDSSSSSSVCSEEVDLIELNHFHDCLGRHVYDQVIFYEWSSELNQYHVRAWCLVEEREPTSRRPTRTYSDNRYHVRWHDRDQNLSRRISSQHFRESWTQVDPERANKKLLDERSRTALVKRTIERPKPVQETVETPLDSSIAQQQEDTNLVKR